MSGLCRHRTLDAGDLNFVLSSWLKNYRASEFARHIPATFFFDEQRGHKALVLNLLWRARTIVAVDLHDDQHIFGWACGGDGVLHYVFVKQAFQHLGIGSMLTAALGLDREQMVVSHWNDAMERWRRRGVRVQFNPYAAIFEEK